MIPASIVFVSSAGGQDMLSPDYTLFVILVLFIALVPILNALLFKPIQEVLEERERLTTGAGTEARAMTADVEQKIAEYEETIREARAAGYRAIEERRGSASADRQARIDEARAEAMAKVAAARDRVVADGQAARASLEAAAGDAAAVIASGVLGRAVGGPR